MQQVGRLFLAIILLALTSVACTDEVPLDTDWRTPDPANLIVMQLVNGVVVIELAANFAPRNVANIKTLVREEYFDGLAIIRSQDNYVVQWADPTEEASEAKSIGSAAETVAPEFQRPSDEITIATIDSRDAYADVVGFADGFPAGSDGSHAWLTHCYGMVGVARGNATDSGNGTSLYVITGHAPRHLDRNITLAGRVLMGMELLSVLPRGPGPMGFYENADQYTSISSIRMGDKIDDQERIELEVMRTDTEAFSAYVKSRTFRNEEWFVEPTGRIGLCNISPPVRITD